MICACCSWRKTPRGLPARKRLLVLNKNRSVVSWMTCFGSCEILGTIVGWCERISAERAEPSLRGVSKRRSTYPLLLTE
jgi:hypothetical protein